MFKDETSNDPVNKEAAMLLSRASWLNLPPDQFKYLMKGGRKPKSVNEPIEDELKRIKQKMTAERKYRRKAEKQLKSFQNYNKGLLKKIEKLEIANEAFKSVIKDLT